MFQLTLKYKFTNFIVSTYSVFENGRKENRKWILFGSIKATRFSFLLDKGHNQKICKKRCLFLTHALHYCITIYFLFAR